MIYNVLFLDFSTSLGLPDLSKFKDVFNFKMNSITVNKLLGRLHKVGLSKVNTNILKVLEEIEVGQYLSSVVVYYLYNINVLA